MFESFQVARDNSHLITLEVIHTDHKRHHLTLTRVKPIERENKRETEKREGRQDNTAFHEDCMIDMKSPENSGNWFGLF